MRKFREVASGKEMTELLSKVCIQALHIQKNCKRDSCHWTGKEIQEETSASLLPIFTQNLLLYCIVTGSSQPCGSYWSGLCRRSVSRLENKTFIMLSLYWLFKYSFKASSYDLFLKYNQIFFTKRYFRKWMSNKYVQQMELNVIACYSGAPSFAIPNNCL